MVKNYKAKRALKGVVFLAFFAAAAAIVMLLWNAIIPSVIGWGALTYWKACGILLLCKLLFSGFGLMGHCHPHRKQMMEHAKKHMSYMEDMREKMSGMSREERREYVRRRMEEYRECCGGPEAKTESAE